jgi:hypothetical protein
MLTVARTKSSCGFVCLDFNCARLIYQSAAILFTLIALFHHAKAVADTTSDVSANVNTDEQWERVKLDENNDITIYYRKLSSGNIEFRGTTRVTSSMNAIVAVFLDLDQMPQWLHRTKEVTLVERIKVDELYVHMIHTMPFPFRRRDSVNHILFNQSPDTKTITIQVKNIPDYIDPMTDIVRVPLAVSKWELTPLDKGQVKITFSGYGEPGGSISSKTYHSSVFQWLVKQFLWKVPYETLLNLKEFVGRGKYQNRTFEFVAEPFQ